VKKYCFVLVFFLLTAEIVFEQKIDVYYYLDQTTRSHFVKIIENDDKTCGVFIDDKPVLCEKTYNGMLMLRFFYYGDKNVVAILYPRGLRQDCPMERSEEYKNFTYCKDTKKISNCILNQGGCKIPNFTKIPERHSSLKKTLFENIVLAPLCFFLNLVNKHLARMCTYKY
jgi:hypothetical protein